MSLACCQATGLGLTSAVAGETASFRIAAHDSRGNPIMTGGASVNVKVTTQGVHLLSILPQSRVLANWMPTGCQAALPPLPHVWRSANFVQ